jgi:hypothetical protein
VRNPFGVFTDDLYSHGREVLAALAPKPFKAGDRVQVLTPSYLYGKMLSHGVIRRVHAISADVSFDYTNEHYEHDKVLLTHGLHQLAHDEVEDTAPREMLDTPTLHVWEGSYWLDNPLDHR